MWDGHLEGQKNPDRLKRSIHVDRIGVHSTFVYIFAVLRVLMIWANGFFLLTCLFFLENMYVFMFGCMYVCMFVCMYVFMFVYVCMYVCMYVCLYVCMFVYVRVYVWI